MQHLPCSTFLHGVVHGVRGSATRWIKFMNKTLLLLLGLSPRIHLFLTSRTRLCALAIPAMHIRHYATCCWLATTFFNLPTMFTLQHSARSLSSGSTRLCTGGMLRSSSWLEWMRKRCVFSNNCGMACMRCALTCPCWCVDWQP